MEHQCSPEQFLVYNQITFTHAWNEIKQAYEVYANQSINANKSCKTHDNTNNNLIGYAYTLDACVTLAKEYHNAK